MIDLVLEPVDWDALEGEFQPIHIWEWRNRTTFCGTTGQDPPHSCQSRIGLRSETPTHCPTCGRPVCDRCVEERRRHRGR